MESLISAITAGVEAVNKDAFVGTSTVLSCKITGLDAKATVVWKKGSEIQQGSQEGVLSGDGSQNSTLTVGSPQNDDVYTCVVTSGQYPTSTHSETTVSLNVYCECFLLKSFEVSATITHS